MAITAPTGVAAINAGGVTIHSFFQLPLSPFIPVAHAQPGSATTDRHELIKKLRFNGEKLKLIRQLELLVIDEISMVRCDTLDAIDLILRHVRNRPHDLFGGVQMLFIGDMMQLPPVFRENEWSLLADYYSGPYFFNSQALSSELPVHIEFSKIYRQSDERFISLLNQVRNNELDRGGLALLESRYDPQFRRKPGDGFIILTTHNEKARQINQNELASLLGMSSFYEAKIEKEFPEKAFPAELKLELKVDAQVMFIRNDSAEKGKRYFNGRIGRVTRLEKEKIFVLCEGDEKEIEVLPETWENIRYSLNPQTRALEQQQLGSFKQFPLRLAWAITIHKSQGLTFDRAIIDAGAAFAPGQVYVALSRCTNLEGLVLQTRINPGSLLSDRKLLDFTERQASSRELENEFQLAKKIYHLRLLVEQFDMSSSVEAMDEILKDISEHRATYNDAALPWAKDLSEKLETLGQTAKKFAVQLEGLVTSSGSETALKERLNAAKTYFLNELRVISLLVEASPVVTDSYIQARDFSEALREVYYLVTLKKQLLEKADLFDIENIQQVKKSFRPPTLRVNAHVTARDENPEHRHPELYLTLKRIRDSICTSEHLPVYLVASSNTLKEMASYLPRTLEQLQKISGFGPVKAKRYGNRFLDPIIQYADENGLVTELPDNKKSREKAALGTKGKRTQGDSRKESLSLYLQGRTIEEIAAERKLAASTVESHLSYFVGTGEISLEQFIGREKIDLIEQALEGYEGTALTPIKERLGDAVSFNDIRLVISTRIPKEDS
jgi:hypothetical protein